LGLVLALGLMLLARVSLLKRRKSVLAAVLVVLLAGGAAGFASGEGALRAYSKVERLAEAGADVRPHIYRISWQLFIEKPLTGHGIGSFQRVFHQHAAEYMQQRPGTYIGSDPYTHPHNELLYWAVEGGVLALAGILLAVGAVVMRLVRLGWQRGVAMAALLAPLGMHALVEWPFYVSVYHWILLMLLLFIVFSGRDERIAELKVSMAGRRLLAAATVALVVGIWAFCGTAYYYSGRIMQVFYSEEDNLAELQTIRKHPYFTELSNAYLLRTLFYHERSQGQLSMTPNFIQWAEEALYHAPEAGLFRDLIRAYLYVGRDVDAAELLLHAQALFPGHADLETVAREVRANKMTVKSGTEQY
jgi:O-antigen polymerase